MRGRYRKAARAAASAALAFLVLKLGGVGQRLLRFVGERRRLREEARLARPRPGSADERTIRRMAEAEHGGMSSAEGTARWLRGENPGGLHHKAVRRPAEEADMVPERERPTWDEPQGRKERVPGGVRHIPTTRRGA